MDIDHLDTLARSLARAGSRRTLLTSLAALPAVGGLLGRRDLEETAAKDRRRRRKQRHKRRKDPGSRKEPRPRKACRPEPVAETCAGRCGTVRDACQNPVDCGPCACSPACGACWTCEGAPGTPGTCVPEAAGTPCGDRATCASGALAPGDACDGHGACVSPPPVSCAPYLHCDGDACATSCGSDNDCVASAFCNASGHCAGDGDPGDPCLHGGQCASGYCVEGICCDAACDGVCQTCTASGSVGTCVFKEDGTTCGADTVCCAGACQTCCDSSQCAPCEMCDGGVCSVDSSLYHTCGGRCPSGQWCDAGACASIAATVRIPDCQSRCGVSMEVCGQTVSCPACNLCISQTGCSPNTLQDGPLGPGDYCSLASNVITCDTNADCADDGPFAYCAVKIGQDVCARLCPF